MSCYLDCSRLLLLCQFVENLIYDIFSIVLIELLSRIALLRRIIVISHLGLVLLLLHHRLSVNSASAIGKFA